MNAKASVSFIVHALSDFILRSMYHMSWLASLLVGSKVKGLPHPNHFNSIVSCAGQ